MDDQLRLRVGWEARAGEQEPDLPGDSSVGLDRPAQPRVIGQAGQNRSGGILGREQRLLLRLDVGLRSEADQSEQPVATQRLVQMLARGLEAIELGLGRDYRHDRAIALGRLIANDPAEGRAKQQREDRAEQEKEECL
jgi:hypothetical protein